jgi:pimeloyl-ACP methyl ester carboxylesterase
VSVQEVGGAPVQRVIDGNAVRIVVRLSARAASPATASLRLDGRPKAVAECTLAAGSDSCAVVMRADGWAWENQRRVESRTILAQVQGLAETARATVPISAKPLILVHGLSSDHLAWSNWTKPGGFLALRNLTGYAVDDGQFGTRRMNTGNPSRPLDRTFTVGENAQVLAEYVEAVRANTGAERVDLVGHSLGGLISRYYVQNLMPVVKTAGLPDAPAVNQVYMAGTPNAGSVCGRILASLGFFAPASTQITPEYMTQIFNTTVRDTRGVPIFAIAGNAIKGGAAIRCSETPTDRYVSVDSVLRGIPVQPDEISALHGELSTGQPTFERIFASLARSPDDYPIRTDNTTTPAIAQRDTVQNTIVQGGVLQAGAPVTLTINVDQARSASFILYAPGSVVSMSIKTVAGRVLTEESPQSNASITFERVLDDNTPLTLGYGVAGPRAGVWEIYLTAKTTPPGGGPFALAATLDTDLIMSADAQPAIARAQSPVVLSVRLSAANSVQKAHVRAQVRREGRGEAAATLDLFDDGKHGDGAENDNLFAAMWTPNQAGEYAVAITATGIDGSDSPFERMSLVAVQVQ